MPVLQKILRFYNKMPIRTMEVTTMDDLEKTNSVEFPPKSGWIIDWISRCAYRQSTLSCTVIRMNENGRRFLVKKRLVPQHVIDKLGPTEFFDLEEYPFVEMFRGVRMVIK